MHVINAKFQLQSLESIYSSSKKLDFGLNLTGFPWVLYLTHLFFVCKSGAHVFLCKDDVNLNVYIFICEFTNMNAI